MELSAAAAAIVVGSIGRNISRTGGTRVTGIFPRCVVAQCKQEDERSAVHFSRNARLSSDSEAARINFGEREDLPVVTGSRRWQFEKQGVDWMSLAGRTERGKKRCIAMIIGYIGRRYKGLQILFNVKEATHEAFPATVESELELALFLAGAILPDNFGNPRKIHWGRVGRTDAGVSAVCNVVTARLVVEGDEDGSLDSFVQRVNTFLPDDIVLHAAVQVNKNFNARLEGSTRSYQFMLPACCVASATAASVSSALSSLGAGVVELDLKALRAIEDIANLRGVRVTDEECSQLQEALSKFLGEKFQGNFTTRQDIDFRSAAAYRFTREIKVGEPLVDSSGQQWLPITVVADSFLTHQIRKMVATAAMVALGKLPPIFMRAALDRRIVCKTPQLPPYGLMFLAPRFGHSGRGQRVDNMIQSLLDNGTLEAWQLTVNDSILNDERSGIDSRWWVRWLADSALNDDKWQGRCKGTLVAYEGLLRERQAKIPAKDAAAVQQACIAASNGFRLRL